MRPDPGRPCGRGRSGASGVVLIALLILIALTALAALGAAQRWGTTLRRASEAELLFVGNQYRNAIESYWAASPGPVKQLPGSVAQLLKDDRFPQPVAHLRRTYPDPVTGEPLQLIMHGQTITGVRSPSTATPFKHAGFPDRYAHFENAATYEQWRFVFTPPKPGPRPAAPRATP